MTTALHWLGDDTVIETLRDTMAEGLRPEPGHPAPGGAVPKAWSSWLATCLALDWIGLVDTIAFVGAPDDVLGDTELRRAFDGRATQLAPTPDAVFAARREAATPLATPDAAWRRRHQRNLEAARRGEPLAHRQALWLVHGTAGHIAAACEAERAWSPHPTRAAVLAPHAVRVRTVALPSLALEAIAAADDNERAFDAARSWREVHVTRRERLAAWLDGDDAVADDLGDALAPGRPGTTTLRTFDVEWGRPPVEGEDPDRPIVETARLLALETQVERAGLDIVERWLRCFGEWRGPVRDDVLRRARPVPT